MSKEVFENESGVNASYRVFIEGDQVDLCVPSKLAIFRDGWADWFNDKETTKYLDQGIFPNRIEDQIDFYESLKSGKRLALMIKPKQEERAIGVISLGEINLYKRSASIAMVFGIRAHSRGLYALEAMARMTEHGFEALGLDRIHAGQAYPDLKNWNKRLELLGYTSEGIERKAFVKGHKKYDRVSLACLYEDYVRIKELRKGLFWLGNDRMQQLVESLPETGFAEILEGIMCEARDQYFSQLKFV